MIERFEHYVDVALAFIVKVLGIALLATVTLQILARYLPFTMVWTEEMSRLLFVWYAMLSVAMSYIEEKHLFLDVVYNKLKPMAKHILDGVSHVFVLLPAIIVTMNGFRLLKMVSIQKAPILSISMAWFYAAVPVGFLFVLIHAVFSIYNFVFGKGRRIRKTIRGQKEG